MRPGRRRQLPLHLRQARLAPFQETLHPLVPRLAADPVRAAQPRYVPAATSQSSMNFLRSSTGPVSFQGILEVSTIRSDSSVNNQPGSYTTLHSPSCIPRNPYCTRPYRAMPAVIAQRAQVVCSSRSAAWAIRIRPPRLHLLSTEPGEGLQDRRSCVAESLC